MRGSCSSNGEFSPVINCIKIVTLVDSSKMILMQFAIIAGATDQSNSFGLPIIITLESIA